MVPYELLQDLNKLVCSSKNKKIEDLFIKLANESQGDFYSWIIKNNKNQEVMSSLLVPEVLSALNYLFKNGKELNSKPHDIIMYSMIEPKGKNKKLDPIFLDIYGSISEFYDLPQYKSTFLPFSNFFRYFKEKVNTSFLNKDKIREDIDTLINKYNESVKHHHMSPHEFKKDKKDRGEVGRERDLEIIKKRRELTHNVYGFLLKHFTEEIQSALSNQGMWDKLKVVLNNRQLADYTRVLDALPYVPNLKDSPKAIKDIIKDITYFPYNDMKSNKVANMGLTNFFNYVRHKLFSSLGVWTSLPDDYKEKPYQKDLIDDKSYFDSGGLPSGTDVMQYEKVEEEPQPVQSIQKYNEMDVKRSAYIWAVSILLSNLRQTIIDQRSINPDSYLT